MKYYLGIDNGLNGGLTLLNDKCEIVQTWIMPIIKGDKSEFDIVDINLILDGIKFAHKDDLIYIGLEKAHVRPVQGIRAAFTTGFCFGMFQALITSKGFSYEIINPSVWMKQIFIGMNTEDKKASVMFCQRKWPTHNWKATERSSKIHDGLTDSACIALYLYQRDNGGNQNASMPKL